MASVFARGAVEEQSRLVFDVFDTNRDGRLTRQELEATLHRLKVSPSYTAAVRLIILLDGARSTRILHVLSTAGDGLAVWRGCWVIDERQPVGVRRAADGGSAVAGRTCRRRIQDLLHGVALPSRPLPASRRTRCVVQAQREGGTRRDRGGEKMSSAWVVNGTHMTAAVSLSFLSPSHTQKYRSHSC